LPTPELCRKHGLSPATFYKLKAKSGGMALSDARRLTQLEDVNATLKRLLADTMLDNLVLKDLTGNRATQKAGRLGPTCDKALGARQ
jgi:putative transposase